ncbi:TIGR01777 family oxidoreductase [Flavobacterium sp. RHBU_24]|uniref:TIGR01777 family oxidoreductase n=1 Tax=Flavobacterium sp. RHBU_24 TaxID=3391185 RepID=UPI00398561AD
MRVLISGATGLVGKNIVQVLHKQGYHIHYLTTSRDKVKDKKNYTGFYWNPIKGDIDIKCLENVGVIIHLAGASISKRWTTKYKQEIIESRVLSTKVLYTLLKNTQNTVHHFISASATGVYPSSTDKVYNEDSPERDSSFLGTVVQQWEAAADEINTLGIKVAKLRTGLVLSGKGGVLKELAGPVRLGIGSAFGSGKQVQSWIHADDLACMYMHILKNGLEGVYNGVAPHPVTQHELVKTIAKVLDKPYFMPNIPQFVMRAVLGEMSTLLFDSQHVSARKIIDSGYQFKYLSLEKAITDALAA